MIWPMLIVGVGIVWILQGFDILGQEGGMNGETRWIVFGAVTAFVGAFLVFLEARRDY